jgi:succinoglycan biosynthesis protein ExoO
MSPDRKRNPQVEQTPVVSVIMACFQAERTLAAALRSALAQSLTAIEVIVADDASTDDSLGIARAIAQEDPRVRVLATDTNGGPGAARNRAIAAARGTWLAVQDCDDLTHPGRLAQRVAQCEAAGADGIVDDLLFLDDAGHPTGNTLLGAFVIDKDTALTPEFLVRAATIGSPLPDLGYTKPLVRRAAAADIRYDETAKIGEDYQYLLSCLCKGLRILVSPDPMYFYRRHSASISHRLSLEKARQMIDAHDAFAAGLGVMDPGLSSALAARRAGLDHALRYERLVEALKARDLGQALRHLLCTPSLSRDLSRSLRDRLSREQPEPPVEDRVWVLAQTCPSWADSEACLATNDPAALAARAGRARDVVAVGLAGATALGYLPYWRRAALVADPAEAARLSTVLPRGLRLEIADRPELLSQNATQSVDNCLIVSASLAEALGTDPKGQGRDAADKRSTQ